MCQSKQLFWNILQTNKAYWLKGHNLLRDAQERIYIWTESNLIWDDLKGLYKWVAQWNG